MLKKLTDNLTVPFYDVENDIPDYPNEYGLAGWLDNDEAMLVYDQFDIWSIDPAGKRKPVKITSGREFQITTGMLNSIPRSEVSVPAARFSFTSRLKPPKTPVYAWLDLKTATVTPIFQGKYLRE
jgi:hypothetical protein